MRASHRLKDVEGDELHKVRLQILCSLRSNSIQLAQEGADDEQNAQQPLSTPSLLFLSRCWVGSGHFQVGPQAANKAGWVICRHAESHICQAECMQGLRNKHTCPRVIGLYPYLG